MGNKETSRVKLYHKSGFEKQFQKMDAVPLSLLQTTDS